MCRPRSSTDTAAVHPLLRASAEQQSGLFTAVDARRAGYEHSEIRHLCASGRWVRLRRGVYTTTESLTAAEARGGRHRIDCLAVLLDLNRPEAALSHGSAARLRGICVRRDLGATVRLTDPTVWRRGRGFT